MKIGILTFWWSNDNYGQLLQCYALQKYLRDMGHSPFLIKYRWDNDVKASLYVKILQGLNPAKLIKYIKRINHKKQVNVEQKNNDRLFTEFRNKYIEQSIVSYNSYEELKNNPPEADVYIVGSDQVWRFGDRSLKRDLKKLHAYFLDFGPESVKKMSYAASWGTTTVEDNFAKEIKPLLAKFEYVSVREKTGIELCKKCGYEKAEWRPDPTLLLTPDMYRLLYKENKLRNFPNNFVLLYMLRNDCDFDIETVYQFAKERGLEVIYVTGNGVVDKYDKLFATIPEWLYLIDNAKYIITNSFHCCVFSSLFNRQFAAVPLSGRHAGMNSRIDSLFELLEIDKRYIQNNDFSILDTNYFPKTDKTSSFYI